MLKEAQLLYEYIPSHTIREYKGCFLSLSLGDHTFHTFERILKVPNLIIQPW